VPDSLRTVVEVETFAVRARALLTEHEKEKLIDRLAADPDAGDVIAGAGGLRKLRVATAGQGKRGGARLIYYASSGDGPVYLLLIYAKNEQDDLSPDQQKKLLRLMKALEQ
jgi:hypothetical protein